MKTANARRPARRPRARRAGDKRISPGRLAVGLLLLLVVLFIGNHYRGAGADGPELPPAGEPAAAPAAPAAAIPAQPLPQPVTPWVADAGLLILVDKGANRLYLFDDGQVVWQAPVATGIDQSGPAALDNSFTPLGEFSVANKRVDPPWTSVDGSRHEPGGAATNPLGSHWLGFSVYDWDGGNIWGIHGTDEPESIGHYASDGCVRLHNRDIAALFARVSVGTPIRIIDSRS